MPVVGIFVAPVSFVDITTASTNPYIATTSQNITPTRLLDRIWVNLTDDPIMDVPVVYMPLLGYLSYVHSENAI